MMKLRQCNTVTYGLMVACVHILKENGTFKGEIIEVEKPTPRIFVGAIFNSLSTLDWKEIIPLSIEIPLTL